MENGISNNTTSNVTDREELLPVADVGFYIFSVINAILLFPIIFGNLLVILAYRKYRELQTVLNKFILNLAICDMLVGIITIPAATFMNILYMLGKIDIIPVSVCPFWMVNLFIPYSLATMSIMEIGFILWISIQFPLRYKGYMTKCKARIVIIVSWMTNIPLIFLIIYEFEYKSICFYMMDPGLTFSVLFQSFLYGSILAMAVIHAMIFRITLRLSKRNVKRNSEKIHHFQKQQCKTARFMLIVMVAFAICRLPNCIMMAIVPSYGGAGPFTYFCVIMSMVSSALNPAIYAKQAPKFRIAFKNIVTCSNQPLTSSKSGTKDNQVTVNSTSSTNVSVIDTKL